jgi:hypothetical protein
MEIIEKPFICFAQKVDENISSYLYMHHLCFKCMTSMLMCETYKPMKEQFSHDFHYQIMGWEVCE